MSRLEKAIDVHFHLYPDFYDAAIRNHGPQPTSGSYPVWNPDIALGLMDAMGVDVAITSISTPGVHFGNAAAAISLAKRCNDYAADMSARWPKRFGSFAVLPLPDIDNSLKELARAYDELRVDGVVLLASYDGHFLGEDVFDPLLDELNRRRAVVLVHPGRHPSTETLNLPWPGFMMEYLFDTSRAAVNLLFSGRTERYSNLRMILAHAGGVIPYIAWRLSHSPAISQRLPQLSPSQVMSGLRWFWYDTALSPGVETFGSLRNVADPARILFGSDAPFAPPAVTGDAVTALATSTFLNTEERSAVVRGNGAVLFPRFG